MRPNLPRLIAQTVGLSASHALACAGLALALVVGALFYVAQNFAMTTDTGQLISAQTPWRKDGAALETAFPQQKDSILVVIDGATPELAEDATLRLSSALATSKGPIESVTRPDGGTFFDTNGLLFADLRDLQNTTQRLIDAQPLLGGLAADPSLHGLATTLSTLAKGAAVSGQDAAGLATPLRRLSTTIDAKLRGQASYFSWQTLFSPSTGDLAPPTRRLLMVHPRLAFGDLEPGAAAADLIRSQSRALGLDAAHGLRVGLTGEVPLADEEFGSIRENIGFVGAAMVLGMIACLWGAVRSGRIVGAILLTILGGLVITLALGLLCVGRLNVISVAFIPLFVGLGVDFGIQVAVRFNAERQAGADPHRALVHMAQAIGAPLSLAAAAIFLALGAFLPTDYIGIAQLGVIAGMGMVVAFALNLTLLPALLILLRPAAPSAPVGWAKAAPLDAWLRDNRRTVLIGFVGAMIVSLSLAPWVQFDFNPLHLRDPQTPAMRELAILLQDPDRTPNTVAILAPDADAAIAMVHRLRAQKEVARAVSIDSFVPEGQPLKLGLIQDAALLLDSAINPFDPPAPHDDAQTAAALRDASAALQILRAKPDLPPALSDAAGRAAASLGALAAASPAARTAVAQTVIPPLTLTLDKIRASLTAQSITRENLPADLRADWLSPSGQALVQVTPAGNAADNRNLARFTQAVRAIAPHATGLPIATQEAAKTVAQAFVWAGLLALVLVCALLYAVLRSLREVAFTLAPVVLSGFLTLGTCVAIRQPLNFANIIAFPLLFGVGVAFHIYFVMAWRRGVANLLQSSLARAVLMSALATGTAFGALVFSHHPGTASMGLILMISLVWTLVCALIFEPALLGPAPAGTAATKDAP